MSDDVLITIIICLTIVAVVKIKTDKQQSTNKSNKKGK